MDKIRPTRKVRFGKLFTMNISFKTSLGIIFTAIAGIVACGIVISKRSEGFNDQPETLSQRQMRYYKQTATALDEAITNSIGHRRTIRSLVLSGDQNLETWTGTAEFEFFNRVGGVERTNAYFKFTEYSKQLSAHPIPPEVYFTKSR